MQWRLTKKNTQSLDRSSKDENEEMKIKSIFFEAIFWILLLW